MQISGHDPGSRMVPAEASIEGHCTCSPFPSFLPGIFTAFQLHKLPNENIYAPVMENWLRHHRDGTKYPENFIKRIFVVRQRPL
jgi:hypothetical protein